MGEVAFPSRVANLCLGVGSVCGLSDVTQLELLRLSALADSLHSADCYRAPVDPLRLAARAGIRLYALPPDWTVGMVGVERAFFPLASAPEDQGLWIAHALAGALLRRSSDVLREPHTWTLAALLLAPAWAVDRVPAGVVVPGVPRWLMTLRRRYGMGDGGREREALMQIARADTMGA